MSQSSCTSREISTAVLAGRCEPRNLPRTATVAGLRSSATATRLGRGGHVGLDLLEETLLRHVADEALRFLAALEQDHRRDGADAEPSRGDRVRVDVELGDPDVVFLGRDLFE